MMKWKQVKGLAELALNRIPKLYRCMYIRSGDLNKARSCNTWHEIQFMQQTNKISTEPQGQYIPKGNNRKCLGKKNLKAPITNRNNYSKWFFKIAQLQIKNAVAKTFFFTYSSP